MKYPLFFLFNLLFFSVLHSQNFHRFPVPVSEDGVEFANPWVGGLNAPQWSQVNLNNDGLPDLYAFDRNGEVHLPFLNVGTPGNAKYEFAPWIAQGWPRCVMFAYLRDFNKDGAPDLFTHSYNPGDAEEDAAIKAFRGHFEGAQLKFDRIHFPNHTDDLLFYTFDGLKHEIVTQPADLPAIDDLDGDGDLDILVLAPNGGKIYHFNNIALESGFTDDTLIYELADICWGKFDILPFAEAFTLSNNPDACAIPFTDPTDKDRNPLHGGATLTTFDADGDGDKEVLYGDPIFDTMIFGHNGGSIENAWINSQDSVFPSYDQPIAINNFPGAFYLDLDQDGANDLLVSPNQASASPDYEVTWFYKNIGSNGNAVFSLQSRDHFTRQMLDFGSGANPVFFDYNADGLMDLVVGNDNRWTGDVNDDPFLVLLENVGTATEPAFEVVDRNWLDFNALANTGVTSPKNFTPTFGDLDSDGDLDLLVGERLGRLFFCENLAGPGQPAAFGPVQGEWMGINVGSNSAPFIYDVNGDGLPDLLIGERNGTVNYLPNLGTPTEPMFHPDPDEAPNNKFFGGINTQTPSGVGLTAPVLLDLPQATYVITGSLEGWLEVYLFDPALIDGGNFEIVSEQFGNLREGEITRIAFADLNGDQWLDCVIGNDRGGLGIFQSPITTDGLVPSRETERSTFAVQIFPNPATDVVNVRLQSEGTGRANYRVFNALGQPVAVGQMDGAATAIPLANFGSGLYFLQMEMDGMVRTERFFKK